MNGKRNIEEDPNLETNPGNGKDHSLVLYNDDVHDFMYVIDSLIDVCGHDSVQAEQCTYLVHYRGKCDVKKGKYDQLKVIYDKLIEKGLTASLD